MLCIAGKNDIAVNSLDYILRESIVEEQDVCVCINKTDDGVDAWQKSLLHYATQKQIPVFSLEYLYDKDNLIFISLEFDRIIKPECFKNARLYNIHFSKLPAYKGMYTSVWPLLNGENKTGVTLHEIDKGIDTGDIIDQYSIPISIKDTARTIYQKYLEEGERLFRNNIKKLLTGDVLPERQAAQGASYYGKDSLSFSDVKIDFNKTGFEIYNQIRAFIFPEYQLPTILEHKIQSCEIIGRDDGIRHSEIALKDGFALIYGIDGYIVKANFA